jgi:histidine ammonia-lyase
VVAIELMVGARALDLRAPLEPGPATGAVLALLREHVAGPGPDRFLRPEIDEAVAFVIGGGAVSAAEVVCGPL